MLAEVSSLEGCVEALIQTGAAGLDSRDPVWVNKLLRRTPKPLIVDEGLNQTSRSRLSRSADGVQRSSSGRAVG